MKVGIASVYDDVHRRDVQAILVDCLWPRGIARSGAPFKTWLKDVAPSTELARGTGMSLSATSCSWIAIAKCCGTAREAFRQLRGLVGADELVLLTASKGLDHSGAAELRDLLIVVPTKRNAPFT